MFLDEIATASLSVQEKILRVIEYGSFERVGGNEVQHVDVRLIAATNVDLPELAASGGFRSDLLDRLAFDVVTIPPLRERVDDIALLAEHFARSMARELGRAGFAGFTAEALAQLQAHRWPGNVRELKNVVERSLHRWPRPDDPIEAIVFDPFASPHRPAPASLSRLPRESGGPESPEPPPGDFHSRTAAFEQRLLSEALAAHHFNQRRTAAALGLTYHQLRHYLKKHALGATRSVVAGGRQRLR